MRQFMFDEICREDIEKLGQWLDKNTESSPMTGLYWVSMPLDLLAADQLETKPDQPFCFAIELGENWAKFELLLRSRTNLRSPLTRYATPEQSRYILDLAGRIMEELNILT